MPELAKKLDQARAREEEYLARRVEAGDKSAKRGRIEPEAAVELEPGPGEI